MEEEFKNEELTEETNKENFNDNLHGENLNDRVKVLSPAATVAKRFFRSKLSVIGLAVIIFLFVFSFFGPLISPWGADEGTARDYSHGYDNFTSNTIDYEVDGVIYYAYSGTVVEDAYDYVRFGEPSTSCLVNGDEVKFVLIGSVWVNKETGETVSCWDYAMNKDVYNLTYVGGHWLGTDDYGYDVLTRLMYGGRISLTIGFVVIILETLIGILLGGIAGYFGGWVDQLIMRIVDILSCIPTLPILLILSAVFNDITSIAKLYFMMIFITLIGWTGIARLVRGQILSLREQEFMLAAKCSGLSTGKKIFKHLLPNIIPQLVVSMTMGLGGVILMEATLGYLGLGAPLGTATWGNIIELAGREFYRNLYPNLWVGAGVCITLAILAFNFVGDGLRDAFDPKMKR